MKSNKKSKPSETSKDDSQKIILAISKYTIALIGALGLAYATYNINFIIQIIIGNDNKIDPAIQTRTSPNSDSSRSIEPMIEEGFKFYNNSEYDEALKVFDKILGRSDLYKHKCIGCLYSYRGYCP